MASCCKRFLSQEALHKKSIMVLIVEFVAYLNSMQQQVRFARILVHACSRCKIRSGYTEPVTLKIGNDPILSPEVDWQ
jgi:hypothetical protein